MAYQIPSLPSLSSSTLPCSSKTWPRSAAGSAALVQGGFVGKLVHDAFSRFLAYNHARQHLESYGLTSSSSSPCQAPSSSAPAQEVFGILSASFTLSWSPRQLVNGIFHNINLNTTWQRCPCSGLACWRTPLLPASASGCPLQSDYPDQIIRLLDYCVKLTGYHIITLSSSDYPDHQIIGVQCWDLWIIQLICYQIIILSSSDCPIIILSKGHG